MKLPVLNNINMTYIIFILVIIAAVVEIPFTISIERQLTNQQQVFHDSNVRNQQTLTGYIKCLSLLRFTNPELLRADVTKQQVSNALDKCAQENR